MLLWLAVIITAFSVHALLGFAVLFLCVVDVALRTKRDED